MAKQKTPPQRSPWLTISIGLFGLVIGYVMVMSRTGTLASANNYACPMKKEICTGAGCKDSPACKSGACSKDCPGNCNHAA